MHRNQRALRGARKEWKVFLRHAKEQGWQVEVKADASHYRLTRRGMAPFWVSTTSGDFRQLRNAYVKLRRKESA